jgi:hypothetical protein
MGNHGTWPRHMAPQPHQLCCRFSIKVQCTICHCILQPCQYQGWPPTAPKRH